jgi:hypothetical protein
VYAASDVVPQQFRGNIANCMIAYELAYRMQVNVFMLMQSMYVVSGKPGLEAKMAIALVNARGPFRGTIQFKLEHDSSGAPVACTAYATLKQTGDRVETTVTWDVVEKEGWDKKSGSKWKTMPEQMFKYRAASWLARTYCPEVLMGMHTTDELEDTYSGTRFVESTSTRGAADELNERLNAQPDAMRHRVESLGGEVVNEETGGVTEAEATEQSADSNDAPESTETAAPDETQNKADDDAPRTITTVIGAITGGKGNQPYTISTADGDFKCSKLGIVNAIGTAKGDGGEVELTLTIEGDVVTAVEIPE